jgi:hypothetical protein
MRCVCLLVALVNALCVSFGCIGKCVVCVFWLHVVVHCVCLLFWYIARQKIKLVHYIVETDLESIGLIHRGIGLIYRGTSSTAIFKTSGTRCTFCFFIFSFSFRLTTQHKQCLTSACTVALPGGHRLGDAQCCVCALQSRYSQLMFTPFTRGRCSCYFCSSQDSNEALPCAE